MLWGQWFSTPGKQKPGLASMADSGSHREPQGAKAIPTALLRRCFSPRLCIPARIGWQLLAAGRCLPKPKWLMIFSANL